MTPARRRVPALLATLLLGVSACTSGQGPSGSASPQSPQSPSSPTTAGSSAHLASPPRVRRLRVTRVSWRLPEAVSRGVAVPVPGGAVLAGGLLSGDVSTPRTYRLRLPQGRWRALPPLPTAAHDVAGALLRGQPAVFGGGAASELSTVQALGPDGVWRTVGRLPGARSDLAAVNVPGNRRGAVVIIGGYDGATSPRSILRTSDGRRFATVGALPEGVRYAAVAVLGHTAWVLGGEENSVELSTVYAVDLRSGRVRRAGRMPRALGHESAVVEGDRILLMGGRSSPEHPVGTMWWFQPSSGTWRRAGRLPYPLADAPTVVSGGAAYLLGGETPSFTDRVLRVTWR